MLDVGVPLAYLLVAVVSLGVGLLSMPVAVRLGKRFGMVDVPRLGESQTRPLPRSGGYAVALATAAGMAVSVVLLPRYPDEWMRLTGLAAGMLLIIPLALLDDLKRLSPWPQLAGQIGIALVTVWLGVGIDAVSNPFGGLMPVPALLVVPLSVVWIVGMINTVNFADGVDGLAGGIGVIGATTLMLVSIVMEQYTIAALALALAAATLAFLRWNFHPARIILGTSGATLIGFLLAVLAIIGGAKIATALMVLGLPIADVATVILYRLSRGRSPFRGGDQAHLHHRLLALGLSQRQVVGVFYALCAGFGALAIALTSVGRVYGLVAMLLIVVLVLGYVLNRTRWHISTPPPPADAAPDRDNVPVAGGNAHPR